MHSFLSTIHPTGTQNWKWLIRWLADHQLVITGLVAPALLFQDRFPHWVVVIGWALLALPWVCRLAAYRHLTRPTPVDMPVVALSVMVLVSLYASIDHQRSFRSTSQLAIGVSVFYGLTNVRHTRLNQWFPVAGLIIMSVGLALIAPLIVTWSSNDFFFFERAYSQLTPVTSENLDANILAAVLSMTLIVLAALVWRGQFRRRLSTQPCRSPCQLRLAMGFAGLLLFLAQAFTQSRGAAVGLLVGLFALLALYRRKLLLILAIVMGATYLATAIIDLGPASDLLLSAVLRGWIGRRETWSHAMRMITTRPLTGIGMGTYLKMLALLFPFSYKWPMQPTHAHNMFLQVGVDLGIPGLVAYVAILTSCLLMVWQAWRTFRGFGQRDLEALAAGVFASLIAMITHGLVDAPLWGTKPSFVAWFFMGLAAMLYVHSLNLAPDHLGTQGHEHAQFEAGASSWEFTE